MLILGLPINHLFQHFIMSIKKPKGYPLGFSVIYLAAVVATVTTAITTTSDNY